MALDLATAEKIGKAGIARAQEMGIKISIAVVDAAGNMVYVARMDGASFFSAYIGAGKAFTSAAWRVSSGETENKAKVAPYFYESAASMSGGRAVIRQGALPISMDGTVVGAVGVSGGTSTEDEEVARAGLTVIA